MLIQLHAPHFCDDHDSQSKRTSKHPPSLHCRQTDFFCCLCICFTESHIPQSSLVDRELASSQKHCHIPTPFPLKVLFIKKAHTWGRRSFFTALPSQAPADLPVQAPGMFAALHLLQLLLASPNPDSQELPSALTCYFLVFVCRKQTVRTQLFLKKWCHNILIKKVCLQRGVFYFLCKNIWLLTENDKEDKSCAFNSSSKHWGAWP